MPFLNSSSFLFAAYLLFFNFPCRLPPLPQLSGTVIGTAEWRPKLYLIQPRSFAEIAASFAPVVLDSAWIESDGSFSFTHLPKITDRLLVELCIQPVGSRFQNQFLNDNPLTANYMPLVIHKGEKVKVFADADRLQATFSISNPSEDNRALLQLRDLRHQTYSQQMQEGRADEPAEGSRLLDEEAALQRFQAPLIAFADSTDYFWPALVAIRWTRLDGDYERLPEFLVRQCQKWQQKSKNRPWAAQLCQAANREKLPLLVGDRMPDYALPLVTGDTVLLHTLLGKRLTVLDIWASWCAPCRHENRENLPLLYAQYSNQGLGIIGYSIDADPAAWRVAIDKDKIAWPQASHLTGDATPFMEALRITTIPANFLLDAQGKVVAKNLHGQALQSFVTAYFK